METFHQKKRNVVNCTIYVLKCTDWVKRWKIALVFRLFFVHLFKRNAFDFRHFKAGNSSCGFG